MSTKSLMMLLTASTAWAAVAPVYEATTTAAPAYTTGVAVSDCAKACVEAYRTCQSDVNNTRAQCASDLASCVNYNPFDNSGSFVTPTACSSKVATQTASHPAPVYTTKATEGTSDCAKNCVAAFRTCQSDLSNTRAQCASDLAACVNYNPFDNSGSFVTPTACSSKVATQTASHPAPAYTTKATEGTSDCAKNCVAAFRTCQSDLNNTRAQCASDLASCVNYNPFDNSGTFVTPTACSSSAAATATASTVPASYAPAPSAPAGASDCAKNCVTAFRTCQSDLNNTRAQCASDLASCVNYNPFDNSGTFVTPTACSASATATSMPAATNGTMATGTASATYSAPPQYTGAASLMSGSFLAIAAGAVGLLI